MSKPQKPAHARTIRRRKRAAEPEATPVPIEPQDASSPPQKATNTRVSKVSAKPPAETPTETLDGSALLAEIEAMGADAFAALMAGGSPDQLEAGDQVEGSVVRVTEDTVFVNIGAKAEGFMERAEFEGNAPAIGAQITAFVVQAGENIQLSRQLKGEASWEGVHQAFESGAAIDGRVENTNPGGLVVKLGDVRAFCPISQISHQVPSDLSSYVGRTLPFKIIEVKEREVVVSHRQIADIERQARAESLWSTLEEGAELEGVVSNARDFGVFVDVGGIEGLVPRSELGWGRDVAAPESGTQVTVRVLKVDRLAKRLSLSMKDASSDPWSAVGRTFLPGAVYTGTVSRLVDFGAFISLAPGLEGLAHISKLSAKRISHPKEVLEVGQSVDVRIDEIDSARKRLSLAIPREGDDDSAAQSVARKPQPEASLGTFGDLFGGLKLPK